MNAYPLNPPSRAFAKLWYWPAYIDPDMREEHELYRTQMAKMLSYQSSVMYLVLYVLYYSHLYSFYDATKELDILFDIGIAVARIGSVVHVIYISLVVLQHMGYFVFLLSEWRSLLLSSCLVVANVTNGIFLLARCVHGECKQEDMLVYCNPESELLPLLHALTLPLGSIFTSIICKYICKFHTVFIVTWFNSIFLIISVFLVKRQEYVLLFTCFQSFMIYVVLIVSAYKDMTTFEHYYNARYGLKWR
jgi:hypothetical protein